jgi:hypothetical protein
MVLEEAKKPEKVPCLRGDDKTYVHPCDWELTTSRVATVLTSTKFHLFPLKPGNVPDSLPIPQTQRLGSQTQAGKATIAWAMLFI